MLGLGTIIGCLCVACCVLLYIAVYWCNRALQAEHALSRAREMVLRMSLRHEDHT